MSFDLILEISGFIIGIIYLWYEYHANPRVWLVSIIMPMISMYLYFRKGLYADFGINIYYVVIAIYGYLHWTLKSKKASSVRKADDADNQSNINSICEAKGSGGTDLSAEKSLEDSLPITRIKWRTALRCMLCSAVLWVAIYLILRYLTDSTVPVADAFTTALSIVALWMMARKYAEQWLYWLVVDAVCVGLYIYKGIYFYAALYAVYTVIAWLGYRKWLRQSVAV